MSSKGHLLIGSIGWLSMASVLQNADRDHVTHERITHNQTYSARPFSTNVD